MFRVCLKLLLAINTNQSSGYNDNKFHYNNVKDRLICHLKTKTLYQDDYLHLFHDIGFVLVVKGISTEWL